MVRQIRIYIDNPVATYYGGYTVTGRVVVRIDEEEKIRDISAKFRGEANVRWTEQVRRNGETKSVTFSAYEKYFETKYYFVGGPSQELTLPPGEHVYNFSVKLPENLPSSFEGTYGRIRYTIKAKMNRPWAFDEKVKAFYTVISHLDLNKDPLVKEPVLQVTEKTLCCCCCRSGPLTLVANIPATGFVSGQEIPITVEVDNATEETISAVTCSLKKVLYSNRRSSTSPQDFFSTKFFPQRTTQAENTWKLSEKCNKIIFQMSNLSIPLFTVPLSCVYPVNIVHNFSKIDIYYLLLNHHKEDKCVDGPVEVDRPVEQYAVMLMEATKVVTAKSSISHSAYYVLLLILSACYAVCPGRNGSVYSSFHIDSVCLFIHLFFKFHCEMNITQPYSYLSLQEVNFVFTQSDISDSALGQAVVLQCGAQPPNSFLLFVLSEHFSIPDFSFKNLAIPMTAFSLPSIITQSQHNDGQIIITDILVMDTSHIKLGKEKALLNYINMFLQRIISSNIREKYVTKMQRAEFLTYLEHNVCFTSHTPRKKTKIVRDKIETITYEPVGPNTSKTWTKNLKIPSLPPSNLNNCNIIDLDYFLHVKAVINGPHTNLHVNIPIKLGTIPLLSYIPPELSKQLLDSTLHTPQLPPLKDAPEKFPHPSITLAPYPQPHTQYPTAPYSSNIADIMAPSTSQQDITNGLPNQLNIIPSAPPLPYPEVRKYSHIVLLLPIFNLYDCGVQMIKQVTRR
ncbi:uncharacterized protein LOC126235108 [Schistocerca nitens]|uniref:uncharacterized protein LOC126235108 n=1 Tax=Schistocerca nitens TaxID=7011 RepID=UPI0021188883|nr:uncharacterized protein LOC126235108 [Schistocerca nitens]